MLKHWSQKSRLLIDVIDTQILGGRGFLFTYQGVIINDITVFGGLMMI
jgi:hypothetical protein